MIYHQYPVDRRTLAERSLWSALVERYGVRGAMRHRTNTRGDTPRIKLARKRLEATS